MVNFTNEQNLLEEIEHLAGKGQIQDSAGLTQQVTGSMLTSGEAKSTLEKLIPTTRQRLSATKFYLDLMEHMDFNFNLSHYHSPPTEQKPVIDLQSRDIIFQIKLLNKDTFMLVLFVILNGFFSNLTGAEDCLTKIINIIYDLFEKRYNGINICQKLGKEIPTGKLTRHLRYFYAVNTKGQQNKKGTPFAIATEIRNQLIHDQIDDLVTFSSTYPLSGSSPKAKFNFHDSFFPENTDAQETEITAFCERVFKETEDFIDNCYKLIHSKLQSRGCLPV